MMVDVGRPRMDLRGNEMKKNLLAEGVFHLIGERIVTGALAPGTRIRDAELADELAVSRTPVREALQRLERIGLVTMYPSRYTEVSAVTSRDVEDAHAFAGYQAGIIVRLACARATDTDLAIVSTLIADVAATVDDPPACSRARRELIGYLAALNDNRLLQSLVDEASMALARALKGFVITPEHRTRLLAGCVELDDALHIADADAAEHAARMIYNVG